MLSVGSRRAVVERRKQNKRRCKRQNRAASGVFRAGAPSISDRPQDRTENSEIGPFSYAR